MQNCIVISHDSNPIVWFFCLQAQDEMIEFKTKFMHGFIAAIEYMTVIKELTPAGFTYTCPEDPRVRINFPEDTVEKMTPVYFKVRFEDMTDVW